MTITEIIAALEAAAGPSKHMDGLIAISLGWRCERGHWWTPEVVHAAKKAHRVKWGFGPPERDPPAFTASIDAALTLVPEGLECALYWGVVGFKPQAQLETEGTRGQPHDGVGATPALAMCIAALRAREVAP